MCKENSGQICSDWNSQEIFVLLQDNFYTSKCFIFMFEKLILTKRANAASRNLLLFSLNGVWSWASCIILWVLWEVKPEHIARRMLWAQLDVPSNKQTKNCIHFLKIHFVLFSYLSYSFISLGYIYP